MKKPIQFFLILFGIIILGCVSTEYVTPEYVLPEKPQREALAIPETEKDLLEMIAYYEFKVQEWEAWAEAVEKIINEKAPQD